MRGAAPAQFHAVIEGQVRPVTSCQTSWPRPATRMVSSGEARSTAAAMAAARGTDLNHVGRQRAPGGHRVTGTGQHGRADAGGFLVRADRRR